ncbi:MAG: S41 family peptidase [Planctomycetota bacterium]
MPPRNLLAILLTIVFSLACYSVASRNKYANLFAEAMDVVNREALHPVERDELFVGAMNGMLQDLDEHSVYISGQNYKSFDEDLKQEFGGVGMYVEVDPKSKMLMVLAPMPNTPAFESGMQVGDLIVSIEGEPTYGKVRAEAVKKLRGPIGESVKLEVKRGEQLLNKSITRARIPVESVHGDYRNPDGSWQFYLKEHPEIGYIRLSQFGEKSADEVREALEEIAANREIKGLILDIRANSGGLLDVAVEICDMLIEPGLPIVKIRGRNRVVREQYDARSAPVFPSNIPVCVLIDRYSASASEILAACLQDHERAVMIGEQTYGKGTVQDIIPIQRGESILKLTTASYWRPSGKNIDRNDEISQETKVWGVQPDDGFAIEQTIEDLLRNLKSRNARDIEGLASGAEELLSQIRDAEDEQTTTDSDNGDEGVDPDDDSSSSTDETPEDQSQNVQSSDEVEAGKTDGAEAPHVDRPMQRAIEHLQDESEIVPRLKAA